VILALSLSLLASDFEVSGATVAAYPIAVTEVAAAGATGLASASLRQRVEPMLDMTGMFRLLDRASFLAPASEGDQTGDINWDAWKQVGARGLLKLRLEAVGEQTVIMWRLFDAGTQNLLTEGQTKTLKGKEALAAEKIADAIILRLSGEPGPFASRIAFARREGRNTSIWTTASDGSNLQRVTDRKSLSILPAWGAGGQSLYFTHLTDQGQHLYLSGIAGGPWKGIARHPGSNAGAAMSRSSVTLKGTTYKRLLAIALSKDGNTELYALTPGGKIVARLTDHWAIDCSPSWSPDGASIAFVSNRGGSPQIYALSLADLSVRRLTFKGNYNQTPAWSPRGNLIAFSGRDERNVFDLFTVDIKTLSIKRLTQAQGHNQEPSWAPNGRLLVFSSSRNGKGSRLYVMREDGRHHRLLNPKLGAATTPRWSGFIQR
jgi:TolB protein